jgi:hypothetical protein
MFINAGVKGYSTETILPLAIGLDPVRVSSSLDTFFTSMTWKSSGEPDSMKI